VDLHKSQTILNENQLTKCGWSPWHGTTLTGWPVRTWVMGQTVFADEKVCDDVRGTEIRYVRE
jgi:dihydroorotase